MQNVSDISHFQYVITETDKIRMIPSKVPRAPIKKYLYYLTQCTTRINAEREYSRLRARREGIDRCGITVKSAEFKEKNEGEGTKSGRCETVSLAKRGGI